MPQRQKTVAEFWAMGRRVESGCLVWTGGMCDGYGTIRWERKVTRAHRVAFLLANGYMPELVLHKCDNPPCFEPTHLYDGTRLDNARDRWARKPGNVARGERAGPAKLKDAQVVEILGRYRSGESAYRLAKEYGVYTNAIKYHVQRTK